MANPTGRRLKRQLNEFDALRSIGVAQFVIEKEFLRKSVLKGNSWKAEREKVRPW